MADEKKGGLRVWWVVLGLLLLLGSVLLFIYWVWPELLSSVAHSWAGDQLLQENAVLSQKLNETQIQNEQLSSEVWQLRGSKLFWTLFWVGLLLGVVGLIMWYLYKKGSRGLELEEAEKLFLPKARERYGFPESKYGVVKTGRSFDRVKDQGAVKDERMFFLEFAFHDRFGPGYVKGSRPSSFRVVSVALLNYSWKVNQQWYPRLRIELAIMEAHKAELWGFALQKMRQGDDLRNALEVTKNIEELRAAFKDESAEVEA